MSGDIDADGQPGASPSLLGRQVDLGSFVARLASPTAAALLLAAIVGLIIGGLTAVSFQRQAAVYQSNQPLLIDQPTALALAPNGDLVSKLALLRTKYVSVLQSSAVLDRAAEKLQVEPGHIDAAIGATAPPQSLVIQITVRSGDSSAAPRIATAVSESLAEYLTAEQEAGGVPADKQIVLTALRPASAPAQVEPNSRKAVSTGFTGGLLAAAVTYLLISAIPRRARFDKARSL